MSSVIGAIRVILGMATFSDRMPTPEVETLLPSPVLSNSVMCSSLQFTNAVRASDTGNALEKDDNECFICVLMFIVVDNF